MLYGPVELFLVSIPRFKVFQSDWSGIKSRLHREVLEFSSLVEYESSIVSRKNWRNSLEERDVTKIYTYNHTALAHAVFVETNSLRTILPSAPRYASTIIAYLGTVGFSKADIMAVVDVCSVVG